MAPIHVATNAGILGTRRKPILGNSYHNASLNQRSQLSKCKVKNLFFISLLSGGVLVPSPDVGISTVEVVGMFVSLSGGALYIICNYERLNRLPNLLYLPALAIVWSLLSLFGTSLGSYAREIFGPVLLLFCVVIGVCVREEERPYVAAILLVVCALGLSRDMCVDVFGLNIGVKAASKVAWHAGLRARAVSRSVFPAYLAVFSAPLLFLCVGKKRIIGGLLFGVCLWTGVVMGCGKGTIILILLCVVLAIRSENQELAIMLISLAIFAVLSVGLMLEWLGGNEYTRLFYDRLVSFDMTRRGSRLNQFRYAVNVLRGAEFVALLTGVPETLVRYDNVNIHNVHLGMALRYGVIYSILYGVFWMTIFGKAVAIWVKCKDLKLWQLQAVTMTIIVFFRGLISYHDRWRDCVIPGCMIGLLLAMTYSNKTNSSKIGTVKCRNGLRSA